jgi:glycogen operon protein
MNDLVSYNWKHNEDNGEQNRDGGDNNLSFNCGADGPTQDPNIKALRERQIKNFIASLLVSLGTPMILGGDEMGRTQGGNNTAYCQDNGISWYDWSLPEENAGLCRFVREMIAFRLRHQGFMRPEFYTGRDGNYNAIPDISWFDDKGQAPDWDTLEHCLALRMDGSRADILADRDDNDFFIMFNAGPKAVKFKVCDPMESKKWVRAVDTGLPSPNDIMTPGTEVPLENPNVYNLKDRSMVILISRMLY